MPTLVQRHRFNPSSLLIADTGYGSAPMLDWLVEGRGIAPHIPVIDKSGRKDGTFESAEFTYDSEDDSYTCPGGKKLRQFRRAYKIQRSGVDKEGIMRYRAKKSDCDTCGLKARCTPNEPQRKVPDQFMNHRAMLRAGFTGQPIMQYRASCAKRLRCSSSISSAFLNWTSSDCVAHVVPKTNSISQQQPRTSEN